MNKITHSVHEYLSPDSVNRSGPDVVATDSYTDERRKKRKLSNRESAKRSRVKKQKHLEEMNIQLNQLKIENRELENQIRYVIQHFQRTETENNRLRLEQRLLHSTLLNIRQVWMLHQIDRSSDYVTWPYDENTRVTVQHDPSARIHVSIEADKPLQFERRIDFPNGDIGKVTLTYEGLHRYCFTCKHISHDENSCPLLTPEERDLKRKQRAESYANDDYARLPSQSTQGYNSRSSLKRPRSPPSGRHLSPPSSPRNNRKLHDDKRRKSITSSFSTHQTRASEYSNKDRTNSGRLENRQPHDSNEVWSRLALPYRREGTDRRRNDQLYSRSKSHHENSQKGRNSTYEWRPRRHNETPRNRAPTTREPHSGPYDREEKSRATYDSQKTISDNRVSLESGEIDTNRRHEAATATTERETEEERTRRLKGKAIATGSPSPQEKAAHLASLAARGTSLMIREAPAAPTHRTPYTSPRYDSNQTKQADKPLDNEFGLDLDLDMPMTDLELAEVDNLVLETERLEMDENMMDNDDLLGDSPAYDAEQIEAISQLSPAITGPAQEESSPFPRHQRSKCIKKAALT
ncbi:hypothetical protein HID58_035057 [Brassica napus]|uniref:BZIP domain-containing protein n=1 Tax=Brassica napus TaxID=3708 RepID=A0ABQ8C5T1_BRANA|nr:hypothetical protein HID58_035057 [Brassica napus]